MWEKGTDLFFVRNNTISNQKIDRSKPVNSFYVGNGGEKVNDERMLNLSQMHSQHTQERMTK